MKRKKYANPRKGYKLQGSPTYLDQHEILGGKGMIYITPYSNGKWYFRTWISGEGKYLRKSLRTTNKKDAIELAEREYLNVYATLDRGFKIFGLKFTQMCDEYLVMRQEDVDVGRITQQRHSTLKTQINKWIITFINPSTKVSELNRESFRRYFVYRKQQTKNKVEDVTIRNEQTTINSLAKFGYRKGYLPFHAFEFDPIKIIEPPKRDTFSIEEYKLFYPYLGKWINDAVDSHEIYMRKLIRDFILLKSNTCMRFGEITQLQWKMVKIRKEQSQTLVWCELPAAICKNRKYREFWSRGGNYLERIKKYSEFSKKDDFVFSHPKFNRPLAKSTYYKYWKQIMEFSGFNKLEKDLSYYSLRHFGITARLYAGVPIFDMSKIAGTNVQFIEQHYAQPDMDKLKEDALKSFSIDRNGFTVRT